MHEKILDTFISAEGYEVVRLDRGRKKGGGLCLYIKNSIKYDDCTLKDLNFSDENLEIWFVVLNCDNAKSMIIVNCYRPPNGSIDMESLKVQLNMIPDFHKFEIVTTGDLNLTQH